MNAIDPHLIGRFLDMAEFFLEQDCEQEQQGGMVEQPSPLQPEPQLNEDDFFALVITRDGTFQRVGFPVLLVELEALGSEVATEQQLQSRQRPAYQPEQEAIGKPAASPLDIQAMLPAVDTELLDQLPNQANIIERKMSLHEFIAAEDRKWEQQHSPTLSFYLKCSPRLQPSIPKSNRSLTELFALDLQRVPPEDYSRESRLDKLVRYFRKKELRNWNRKISYRCRKEVADTRVRFRGRFVSKNQRQLPARTDQTNQRKTEPTTSDLKLKEQSETTECPSHQ